MEKTHHWRVIGLLYIAAIGLGGSLAYSQKAVAQQLDAASYTDEILKEAGWSSQQIAELRAATKAAPEPAKKQTMQDKPPAFFTYKSVFDRYRSFEDLPDIGWREANDNVGRIGGWRSYAKQVQQEKKKEAKEQNGESK